MDRIPEWVLKCHSISGSNEIVAVKIRLGKRCHELRNYVKGPNASIEVKQT